MFALLKRLFDFFPVEQTHFCTLAAGGQGGVDIVAKQVGYVEFDLLAHCDFVVDLGTIRQIAPRPSLEYTGGFASHLTSFTDASGVRTVARFDLHGIVEALGGNLALVEVRDPDLLAGIPETAAPEAFSPAFVQEDDRPVRVPEPDELAREIRENDLFDHPMWEPYSRRCIACGRCNFSCPTCSCFSTLDVASEDTPELGVRRRVWAGCHVDRFTEMAGGHDVRTEYGSRMRFKTMHKIHDFQRRFGTHMCIGCGRCDDQCPEYISFSACINHVSNVVEMGAEE